MQIQWSENFKKQVSYYDYVNDGKLSSNVTIAIWIYEITNITYAGTYFYDVTKLFQKLFRKL